MAKITQTAGRNALGTFAPDFAHFNDDILFGENWTTPPQSLIVTGFNGIHVCVLCDPFMTSSFCQVISLLRPHSKPLLQD